MAEPEDERREHAPGRAPAAASEQRGRFLARLLVAAAVVVMAAAGLIARCT